MMGKPGIIAAVNEGKASVSVTFKQRSARYLDAFVKLKCAPDMLAAGVFPNSKEITESFAAFEASKRFGFDWGDKNIRVCVIGDGSTPRTGATFAYRSRWQVVSVDPKARSKQWNIARLTVVQTRFEEMAPYVGVSRDPFDLYVLVHSHSNLADIPPAQNVISIPCCVKHDEYEGRPPDVEYDDWAIWSPERTVKIWHGKARLSFGESTLSMRPEKTENCRCVYPDQCFCDAVARDARALRRGSEEKARAEENERDWRATENLRRGKKEKG